jgi:uncharacterized delta-60 repeat protein
VRQAGLRHNRIMLRTSAFLTLILSVMVPAFAAPGDLDPSYGDGGIARFGLRTSDDRQDAAALLPDGRVISAGTTEIGSLRRELAVARHLGDGSLDPSFGASGIRVRPVEGATWWMVRAAFAEGERVVLVGGCSRDHDDENGYCVARLLADGSADPGFGMGGLVFLPSPLFGGHAAAREAGGKLLIGFGVDFGTYELHRLLPDGSVDPAFGEGGKVRLSAGVPSAIGLQPDGGIVVHSNWSFGISVARFHPNGALDSAFGGTGTGFRTVTVGSAPMDVQPDGKILFAGCSSSTGLRMLRLTASGLDDNTFGLSGIREPGVLPCMSAIAIQPDGKIVLSGRETKEDHQSFARLDASGMLDASFGLGGRASAPIGPFESYSSTGTLMLRPDGRIVAGIQPGKDFGLVSLSPGGSLDLAFGTNGLARTDLGVGSADTLLRARPSPGGGAVVLVADRGVVRLSAAGTVDGILEPDPLRPTGFVGVHFEDLDVQADGRIVVSGWGGNNTAERPPMVGRIHPDGRLDDDFGDGGWRTLGTQSGWTNFAQVLPSGAVGVAGYQAGGFIARLTSAGQPDPGFGSNGGLSAPSEALGPFAAASDSTWIVAGSRYDGRYRLVVSRTVDGDLDPTFGVAGRYVGSDHGDISQNITNIDPRAVLLRPDGRMVVAAALTEELGSVGPGSLACRSGFRGTERSWIALTGLTAGGTLDPSFAGGQPLITRLGWGDVLLHSAAMDGEGRILVSGMRIVTRSPCTFHAFVARLTPQGALDAGFGIHGVRELGETSSHFGGSDLIVLPDGRIRAFAQIDIPQTPFASFMLQGGGPLAPAAPAGDLDGDGIPDAVEGAENRDRAIRDNDVFASERLFAMQQYRDFLAREGDAGGITHWSGQISAGAVSRARVIESFLGSLEFEGAIAPVARLYFAYFLRIPDYEGLDFWINRFRGGNALDGISSAFASSPEFASRYGSLDNGAFVTRVYQNVLGRAPDAGGLAFWKDRLDRNEMTRGQVMLGFSESTEYRATSSSSVYVTMLYFGMLRRSPDPAGFDFWVRHRDAGNSGLALIDGFLDAPEYRARFLR